MLSEYFRKSEVEARGGKYLFSPVVEFRLKSIVPDEQKDDVTIAFCGVLANGIAQFNPILDSLPGQVYSYHAETRKFAADQLIEVSVEGMEDYCEVDGKNVHVVGASLGGVIAPFAITRYRQQNPDADMSRWHVVLVDAPCGADTLMDKNARFLTSSVVAKTVTSVLPPFVKAPIELPKLDEISVPAPEDRNFAYLEHTDDEYKQWVVDQLARMLGVHPLALLFNQVHWMNKVAKDGSFEEACRTGLEGVRTTYLRCKLGNGTVKPNAAEKLKQWIPHMEIEDIDATHVGFLQNQPEFSNKFRKLFARS